MTTLYQGPGGILTNYQITFSFGINTTEIAIVDNLNQALGSFYNFYNTITTIQKPCSNCINKNWPIPFPIKSSNFFLAPGYITYLYQGVSCSSPYINDQLAGSSNIPINPGYNTNKIQIGSLSTYCGTQPSQQLFFSGSSLSKIIPLPINVDTDNKSFTPAFGVKPNSSITISLNDIATLVLPTSLNGTNYIWGIGISNLAQTIYYGTGLNSSKGLFTIWFTLPVIGSHLITLYDTNNSGTSFSFYLNSSGTLATDDIDDKGKSIEKKQYQKLIKKSQFRS